MLRYPILVADGCIVLGLGVVLYYLIAGLLDDGPSASAVPTTWSGLGPFLGTALFTFEGLPLILPIRNAMAEPDRFWPLFAATFVGIVATLVLIGVGGYLTFGAETAPVVLSSLPASTVVLSVKLLYIAAMLFTSPLVFIPGTRIVERWVFGRDGKRHGRLIVLLRLAQYAAFGAVAVFAQHSIETFLGIVGVVTGGHYDATRTLTLAVAATVAASRLTCPLLVSSC